MAEKYLIVFGEHTEQQLKKHLDGTKSHKEASWLYDGLVYREEVSTEDILHLLFKDSKFAPSAMIDNNKWLTPAHFGHNQRIWQQAFGQCLAMADRTLIRFYAYVE